MFEFKVKAVILRKKLKSRKLIEVYVYLSTRISK